MEGIAGNTDESEITGPVLVSNMWNYALTVLYPSAVLRELGLYRPDHIGVRPSLPNRPGAGFARDDTPNAAIGCPTCLLRHGPSAQQTLARTKRQILGQQTHPFLQPARRDLPFVRRQARIARQAVTVAPGCPWRKRR